MTTAFDAQRHLTTTLPHMGNQRFVTDGGIETTLIFLEGVDLPEFATFPLLDTEDGVQILEDYFMSYVQMSQRLGTGIVLDTPTWRASTDWMDVLGFPAGDVSRFNHASVVLLENIRAQFQTPKNPIVISGCLGPRGDGYAPTSTMSASEAAEYHLPQVEALAKAGADVVTALTMSYADEAIGIVQSATAVGVPVAVAFTVETDGSLPDGTTLKEAIAAVDSATDAAPAYFMVNCAHPTHFANVLGTDEPWTARVRGIRANASKASHAELDEAESLDSGHPQQLAVELADLCDRLENLTLLGGCCGTDERHIEQIALTCASASVTNQG